MAARGHINNFSTTINETLTAVDVNIDVLSAAGVSTALAALPSGGFIPMTIDDQAGNREIIWVTGVTSNTLTAARGKEGTSAQAWAIGTPIECRATSESINLNVPIFSITTPTGTLGTSIAKIPFSVATANVPAYAVVSGGNAGRYTPLKAGWYFFEGYVEVQNMTVDTNLDIRLLFNGITSAQTVVHTTRQVGGAPPSPTLMGAKVSAIVQMNGTTDFMELHGRHTGAGTKTFNSARFLGYYLRG